MAYAIWHDWDFTLMPTAKLMLSYRVLKILREIIQRVPDDDNTIWSLKDQERVVAKQKAALKKRYGLLG